MTGITLGCIGRAAGFTGFRPWHAPSKTVLNSNLCRDIIPAVNTVVCGLTASIEAMERRVEIRDSGISQRESVARVAKLNAILDFPRVPDLLIGCAKFLVGD